MKSKHKSSYFPTHPHAEMAEKRRRGTGDTQLRKSPAATLTKNIQAALHTGAERYKAFHSFDPSNKK